MAGNQSRGLIQASKTKGWDPTVIPARGDQPAESIANFDKDQTNANVYGLGSIPGGAPSTTIAEAQDTPVSPDALDFAHPDFARENKNRATRNADPYSGKQEG